MQFLAGIALQMLGVTNLIKIRDLDIELMGVCIVKIIHDGITGCGVRHGVPD